ncbi:hypothetical protein OF83DRAFT_1083854 [Amylostereum chailletii]|nr:hypothetical protein OF83DRAFT_1083854 [Amylostereum chailletii]
MYIVEDPGGTCGVQNWKPRRTQASAERTDDKLRPPSPNALFYVHSTSTRQFFGSSLIRIHSLGQKFQVGKLDECNATWTHLLRTFWGHLNPLSSHLALSGRSVEAGYSTVTHLLGYTCRSPMKRSAVQRQTGTPAHARMQQAFQPSGRSARSTAPQPIAW